MLLTMCIWILDEVIIHQTTFCSSSQLLFFPFSVRIQALLLLKSPRGAYAILLTFQSIQFQVVANEVLLLTEKVAL